MTQFHLMKRRGGILLHPTSLPSHTLDDAYRWLDFMAVSGLSVWQVLPLGVPQSGLSPYQCLSAFAANPALSQPISAPSDEDLQSEDYLQYRKHHAHWLDDYALFMVIRNQYNEDSWVHWPFPLKNRIPEALDDFRGKHTDELNVIYWQQYQLYDQWQKIRQYASERNILLFGDMPIFVAHNSADVWACQDRFLLDSDGEPIQVTGVPPDYFSETGQRWGNPHYDWEFMQHENFRWWLDRLHEHFRWFDLVRIDHFRGLEAVWMIYAQADTAVDGFWQKVPGDELLAALRQEMDTVPLVAEDLGIITPEVTALKEKYNLPGMAILQFAFDEFDDNPHKPKNIKTDTVVYTGTHDNDTTLGWYQSQSPESRLFICEELGADSDHQVVDRMIETALHSSAELAVIPLQDFLHMGSQARMNTPGTIENNWLWSFTWDDLSNPDLPDHIRHQLEAAGRLLT